MRPQRVRPRHETRQHPARLGSESYTARGARVSITFRALSPNRLDTPSFVHALVGAMTRAGLRHGVSVGAYCVMPDHVHILVMTGSQGGDITWWVRVVKRETARAVGVRALFQRSFWDRHARSDEDTTTIVEYLLGNPVRAGLCVGWHDWPWSWSCDHPASKGPPVPWEPDRERPQRDGAAAWSVCDHPADGPAGAADRQSER